MAGKPGAAPEDDDLLVELEERQEDFAPREEETVAPWQQGAIEATTVPDDEDEREEIVEEAPRQAAREAEDVGGEIDPDLYERVTAAEESLRQEKANSVWAQAQAYAEMADTKINGAKVALDTLRDRIATATDGLAAAREAGDVRTEMQYTSSIEDMRRLKGEIETGLSQAPTKDSILAEGRQRAQAALAQEAGGRKVGSGIQARHPLAEQFAQANGWMKTNSRANKSVIDFAQAMTREGYNPNERSFYAELAKRVQASHPALKVSALQASRRAPGKATGRSPVAPARSSSGQATSMANGKLKYTLTVQEQRTMERHKLDPKNPKHQKAWARVRMKSSQREQAQAAR